MQTRKDLVQAHRLMHQRAGLALIMGEPDNPELPLRRLNVGLICGFMVAVLVSAAFGIVGLLRPGGVNVLRKAGTLIIASDNGTRYVWCQNGKLCPVANYASARLVAGEQQKVVTTGSLREFQRGPLIGIPGAPDTVPEAERLLKTPWSVCVRTAESAFAGRGPVVTLVVGRQVGGRRLGEDQSVVVTDGRQPWLIWQNRRWRVPVESVSALTSTPPARVSGKWLNALPTGTDFAPPEISGRGDPVQGLRTDLVGQIYRVDAAGGQTAWYVLLSDGLAKITEIEARLLLTDPGTRDAYPGREPGAIKVEASAVAAAPVSKQSISNKQLPAKPPAVQPYSGSAPLCTTYDDRTGKRGAYLTLGGKLDSSPGTAAGSANGVDEMALPAGGGAIAGLLPNPGQSSAVNTYFLVTEGKRFALKSPEVAQKLGYRLPNDAVPVPAAILGLIPNGPVLDPAAVSTSISSTGQPVNQN